MIKRGHRQKPKLYGVREYAEDITQFSKSLYIQAKKRGDAYDEQYYLGRMHSAKMIRDWFTDIEREARINNRKPEGKE